MYVLCSMLHILRHIFWVQISSKLLFHQDLIQTLQVKNDAPFLKFITAIIMVGFKHIC